MEILKKGSRGIRVKELQEFLEIRIDGVFGPGTEKAVIKWQKSEGLVADGIVGPATWGHMCVATTDIAENSRAEDYEKHNTRKELDIEEHYMPKTEYVMGPIDARWIFLHHTSGWHNPRSVVNNWAKDDRGPIGTEFVLGGPSIKGNDYRTDGLVVQAFPHGNYGWHLGKNGNREMHINSIGIEICNFGYLELGGYHKWDPLIKKRIWIPKDPSKYYTYTGASAEESQIVHLTRTFRGYDTWHRYSDEQVESLKSLIIHIGNRDGIDVTKGLPELVSDKGAKAFEYNSDAFYGRIEGIWSHSNVRKDKFDIFPQQEIMDMLVSL